MPPVALQMGETKYLLESLATIRRSVKDVRIGPDNSSLAGETTVPIVVESEADLETNEKKVTCKVGQSHRWWYRADLVSGCL